MSLLSFLKKRFKRYSLWNDFKILMLSIGVIMIWRGVWNLLDAYLLPNYFLVSSVISILLGCVILILNDNDLGALGVFDSDDE